MNTIELRGLHKSFGSVRAVNDLSLSVSAGEIVAFLGPNGAGKTTTIDMILGLSEPTSGNVEVFGGDPRIAVRAGRVGALLQTGGLLSSLRVIETMQWIASIRGTQSRIPDLLDRVGLASLARRKVGKCSGGEQQRLRFALALLADPDLLILDEPTTGMDVAYRREFWDAMRAEADQGRTIVFATHYLEEAQDFAQRIIVIGQGQLLADGPVAEVRALASGRTMEASFDSLDDAKLAKLRALPGVQDLVANGSRVTFRATDSDALLRRLLDDGARDLIVQAPTLESAFLTLTKDNR